jgi:hypothetical protein
MLRSNTTWFSFYLLAVLPPWMPRNCAFVWRGLEWRVLGGSSSWPCVGSRTTSCLDLWNPEGAEYRAVSREVLGFERHTGMTIAAGRCDHLVTRFSRVAAIHPFSPTQCMPPKRRRKHGGWNWTDAGRMQGVRSLQQRKDYPGAKHKRFPRACCGVCNERDNCAA